MIITDLYDSMKRLIEDILQRYVPIHMIEEYGITEVPHTDRTVQLNDLELFVGTETRLILTRLEETQPQAKIQLFLRLVY